MTSTPPRDPRIPDLVSLQEAADILGISKQAVHKRVEAAQLLGARVGNAWVFRRAVVEAARTTAAE
ncbi:helix-turn-helix domain-containing protein [Micromonospora haikouensis]|uniref:helix-turn-helix domain-containing protein n=1 Tax=Micromonospora haikouensis TaxID=686309 RepID=UPI003D7356E1